MRSIKPLCAGLSPQLPDRADGIKCLLKHAVPEYQPQNKQSTASVHRNGELRVNGEKPPVSLGKTREMAAGQARCSNLTGPSMRW